MADIALESPRNLPPPLIDGRPIVDDDGTIIPQARTFAAIYNSYAKTYSYRYDEALRDSPPNALAMRRDVHLMALLQERISPTINASWQLDIDDPKNAQQTFVRDELSKIVKDIPYFKRMKAYLMETVWYGRYGSQVCWGKRYGRNTIYNPLDRDFSHEPVNGDKIQYRWGESPCPVIMVDSVTSMEFKQKDPRSIVNLDRNGFGLALYKPEYRNRFIIHTHTINDADYFEGEMSGGARGVGLRSLVYWSNWLRTEVFQWMLGFMDSVGLMDLMIFNYDTGDKAAQAVAEANARKISGKVALAVPRFKGGNWQAVETVPANVAGIQVLRDLIEGYMDRGIERLFVGQSMSGGGGGAGGPKAGLEGSGRADFAKDTKSQLLQFDADNLDETLTIQLIDRLRQYNPELGGDFPVRFKSCNPETDKDKKFDNGLKLVQANIPVIVDELREAAGDFTKPLDTDEVIGGQPMMDAPPGTPLPEAPKKPVSVALEGIDSLVQLAESQWEPHTIKSGPRKGTQAYKNKTTGEIRDTKPEENSGGEGDSSPTPKIPVVGPYILGSGKPVHGEGAEKKKGEPKGELHDKLAALLAEHPEHAAAIQAAMGKVAPKEPKANPNPKEKSIPKPTAPASETVKRATGLYDGAIDNVNLADDVKSITPELEAVPKAELAAILKHLNIFQVNKAKPKDQQVRAITEEIIERKNRFERSDY